MTQTLTAPAEPQAQDFGHFADRDLTRRIVGFLSSNGLLRDASLVLKVTAGHVELRGTVTTFRQRERIDAFIRRVAGVHHVTNQLVVGTIAIARGSHSVPSDGIFRELTDLPAFARTPLKRGA
jgi:hypothetical protein